MAPTRRLKRDLFVRTTASVKAEFGKLLAAMKVHEQLALFGASTMSQEAFINASWLWMKAIVDQRGSKWLAKELEPHMRQLEEMVVREEAKEKKKEALREAKAKAAPKRSPDGFTTTPKAPRKRSARGSGTGPNGAAGGNG